MSRTFTGISAHPNARPATPLSLFVASAIVEETWVPWLSSSFAWESLFTKSKPWTKTVLPQSGAFRYGPKSS